MRTVCGDVVLERGAALAGLQGLAEHQFHEILLLRQIEAGGVDIGEPVVKPEVHGEAGGAFREHLGVAQHGEAEDSSRCRPGRRCG